MFERYSIPGSAPATLIPRIPGPGTPPRLIVHEYDTHDLKEWEVKTVAELPDDLDDGKCRWIEMNGLGDVEALRSLDAKYGVHPLALEDALNTGQRPKVEHYERHLFIVVIMVYRDQACRLCGEQVSIILRPNLLISIQEEAQADVFEPVRERLRGGRGLIRKLKCDYLAYALVDSIVDHVFPVLEAIGESIEELEDDLIEQPTRECAIKLHEMKRVLTALRRFTWPERDLVNALIHDDSGTISKQTKVYLRDVYDHTVQIMDLIESYRDVASGLMEMYHSSVSIRTNETVRVLTVISAIFIPLTFLVGIYGMNFAPEVNGKALPLNMPELYHPWGYPIIITLMVLIATGQIIFFRHKKWL